MISSALACRWLCGFSVMKKRPVFSPGEPPLGPTDEAKLAMSGSLAMTAASACCFSIMPANEMSCAASEMPVIRPVSCCGKKPLGIAI
jgi:hypothetical protein